MKRVLFILIAIVGLGVLGAMGAGLTMSDRDLATLLKSVPGAGPYTDTIVEKKKSLRDGIDYMFEDTVYAVKSTYRDIVGFSPADRTPRVVIELEPVRQPKMKKAPMAEAPKEAQTEPMAKPMKLMPAGAPEPKAPEAEPPKEVEQMAAEKHAPAPEPVAPEVKPEPEKIVEKMPEEAKAPAPPPAPAPAPGKKPEKIAKVEPAKAPAPPPSAPEPGNGDAEHKQGLMHYKGLGVPKNFKTARKLFVDAAGKGHPAAQYNLGIMSYLGQGIEQDYLKASDWFRMAADQDHALAQYNLGFLYYGGKGVKKDDLQAFMWIDRAAGLGDEKAIKARDTLKKILPKDIFKDQ